MHDLTLLQWLTLSALIFFAGVVDALAGGGGLITLPAYLSVGLPPALLLGTNKLASSIGTTVSVFKYQKKARLPLAELVPVIAAALIGSWIGARLTALLNPNYLRTLLIIMTPIIAYVVYSHHHFGKSDHSRDFPRSTLLKREVAVSLPVGAYDGFFGPGTGTFLALGFARFCRYDLLGATTRAKIINLASNVAALAAFIAADKVEWTVGLAMGLVSVGGHYTGSHWGVKKGAQIIRPMVALVCAGLFVKLLLDIR